MTEDHVRILRRFARRVLLAFDADAAGNAAAERFYEWEQKFEIDVAVVALPAGVDPGDLARSDPAALVEAVESAVPFLAFRVEQALVRGDMSTVEGRARAAETAMQMVAGHPDPLVRDQYLVQIADRCRIEVDRLRAVASGGPRTRVTSRPDARPEERAELADSVELQVIRLAVHQPELVPDSVHAGLFAEPRLHDIFKVLLDAPTIEDALAMTDDRARPILQRLVVEDPEPVDARGAERLVGRLVDEAATRELKRLERLARDSGDPAVGRDVATLHHSLVRLRESNWQLSQVEGLVAWLGGAQDS